jgi:hypothetical protein
MSQYKTRRGELIAKLGAKKIAAGQYEVAGYTVKMIREASGSKPGLWLIRNISHELAEASNLTAALEMIADWRERDDALLASALESESAEVEVSDEITEPVAEEVAPELVVETVQEDVTPAPAPDKKVKPKTTTYRTRRAELLATLEAREVATAEYHVAGHHVEYVAPGVMPRNAGGRWRTTLLSNEGVVVSWNLSLTAALEVVAARVAHTTNDEFDALTIDTSLNA